MQEKYQGKGEKDTFFLPQGRKTVFLMSSTLMMPIKTSEMEDGTPAGNKETKGWMNRAETTWTLTFLSSSSISGPCQGPGDRGWQWPSDTFLLST